MVINGATEKLRRTLPDQKVAGALDMIATAVKRGQDLTSHLLSFARQQTHETIVLDLAALLPTLQDMLKRSLRGDIDIRTSAEACPCRVRVDQGELELAVLNLGVNARDAMPDGGVLSLSIRTIALSGESEWDGLRGEFVLLEVSDTGVGVEPKILHRVFDPFFTTKEPGKGTGLGLSQVYGFAKQSGGTATIRSKVGHGTTIRLYLPATNAPLEVGEQTPPIVVQRAHRGAVLLVEDNQDVATISADYFEQLGYQVDRAANGAEALSKLQQKRR